MRRLFQVMEQLFSKGQDAVLVTIIASSGSTPRGAGAHMLVTRQGRIWGTVGGGAVEYEAVRRACSLLEQKCSCMETFHLHENQVQDLGMVCGGAVEVYFHYLPASEEKNRSLSRQAETLFAAGTSFWLIADLTPENHSPLSLCSQVHSAEEIPPQLRESLGSKPHCTEMGGRRYYVEQVLRPGRVYIFGGGHVSQALVPVLAGVDFRCVVIEDREEFCRGELFSGVEETKLLTMEDWQKELSITDDDYICIMTRGHKNDTDCQAFALKTPAKYIGVIGSRRKIESVNARLRQQGFTDEDLSRITTPIGLPILAETPAEIAVSIAAQLIHVRAGDGK